MNPLRALPLCLLLGIAPAMADVVSLTDSGSFYDAVPVLGRNQSVTDFRATTAGTVTITLSDVNFTSVLQSLRLDLNSGGTHLQTVTGPGALYLTVSAQQVFSTSIFGIAQGARSLGLYTLDVQFSPMNSVPLPASLWLLATGLACASRLLRKQAIVTVHTA